MFKLSESELQKVAGFIKEQDAKVIELQKSSDNEMIKLYAEQNIAYYGASGGAYSYIFTPTSLGLVSTIKNNLTNEELTLTDFGDW